MQIVANKSYLVATTLDAEYNNVYDDYNTHLDYIELLLSNSEWIYVRNENITRSFRTNGLSAICTVEISGFPSFNIFNKVNYLILNRTDTQTVGGEFEFYFITNKKSLCDRVSTKTFELTLEKDVWTTNYLRLKGSYIQGTKLRGHISDAKKSYNFSTSKRWINTNHITDEEEIPTTQLIDGTYSNFYGDLSILWARIYLDNENIFYLNSGGKWESTEGLNRIYQRSNLHCVLAPYAVINTKTRKIENGYKIRMQSVGADYNLVNLTEILTLELSNTHIMKADFTFAFPDLQSINISGKTITIDNVISTIIHTDVQDVDDQSSGNVLGNGVSYVIMATPFYQPLEYTDYFEYYIPNLPSSKNEVLQSYINEYTYEGRAQLYPYKYTSIRGNNDEMIIAPLNDSEECNISCECITENPFYTAEFISYPHGARTVVKRVLPHTVNNNGQIETFHDSYEAFIRNNGNQANAQAYRAAINAFTSYISAGVNVLESGKLSGLADAGLRGAANSINTQMSIVAQKKDADNKRDTWITSSHSALSDLNYQDEIIFINNVPENQDDFKHICFIFHRYGVNINKLDYIMNIYRTNFDYGKYSNITIDIPIDLREKNRLIEIFNRGFTRWHMHYNQYDNDIPAGALSHTAMNINVYNLPTIFVKELPA